MEETFERSPALPSGLAVQGWSKEDAIREMTNGGFGFHEVWINLPRWVHDRDILSIKRDAGLVTGEQQ